MSSPSIFTRIIKGEIPSEIHYQDEHCIVISDIQPQAPVHLLVIPKLEIPRLVDSDSTHQALLGHLMLVVGEMARKFEIDEAFRLVINNGEGAGQTVFHLHLHILSDKKLSEGSLL